MKMASSVPMEVEVSDKSVEGPRSTDVVDSGAYGENSLNEYETQLLGFTPVTLINGMYNSVCDLYRDALKAFCGACQEKYPDIMTEEELVKARHEVSKEIDKDVSEAFDKLEMFALRNSFTIPDKCVLPEDLCQLEYDPSQGDDVQEKVKEMKKKIIAVKYANAKLTRQLEKSEAFKAMLDKLLASLNDSVQEGTSGANARDVLSYLSDTIMTAFGKKNS